MPDTSNEAVIDDNPDVYVKNNGDGTYSAAYQNGDPLPISERLNREIVTYIWNNHGLAGSPMQEVLAYELPSTHIDPFENAPPLPEEEDAPDEPDEDVSDEDTLDEGVPDEGADEPAEVPTEAPSEDFAPQAEAVAENAAAEEAPAEETLSEEAPADVDEAEPEPGVAAQVESMVGHELTSDGWDSILDKARHYASQYGATDAQVERLLEERYPEELAAEREAARVDAEVEEAAGEHPGAPSPAEADEASPEGPTDEQLTAADDAIEQAAAQPQPQRDIVAQNGVPVDEEGLLYMVQMSVDARALVGALDEILSTYRDEGPGCLVISAISPDNEILQGSDMIADDVGDGRILIGTQGVTPRDYNFVEIEATYIGASGRFLVGGAERLLEWAKQMQGVVNIEHYISENFHRHLMLRSAQSQTRMNIHDPAMLGDESAEDHIGALNQRFDQPTHEFNSAGLLFGVERSAKLRTAADPIGETRVCDLHWRPDAVEFTSLMGQGDHSLGSSVTVEHDSTYDFEMEATADTLRTFRDTLRGEETRYAVDATQVGEDGELLAPVFQIYYEKSAGRGNEPIIGHRQLEIRRDGQPYRDNWLSPDETAEEAIFASDGCQLWASMPLGEFEPMLKQMWAVDPSMPAHLTRNSESGNIMLQGSAASDNSAKIQASFGDAQTEEYLIHRDIFDAILAILGDAPNLQIYSYPDPATDQELPNGMIIVPADEGTDPTVPNFAPDRYLAITMPA